MSKETFFAPLELSVDNEIVDEIEAHLMGSLEHVVTHFSDEDEDEGEDDKHTIDLTNEKLVAIGNVMAMTALEEGTDYEVMMAILRACFANSIDIVMHHEHDENCIHNPNHPDYEDEETPEAKAAAEALAKKDVN